MFPTSKLFKDILCLNYTNCSLSDFCLYSHQQIVVGVRNQIPTKTKSNVNLPQKRPGESLEPAGATKAIKKDSHSSNAFASGSGSRVTPAIASTSRTPPQRLLVDVSAFRQGKLIVLILLNYRPDHLESITLVSLILLFLFVKRC